MRLEVISCQDPLNSHEVGGWQFSVRTCWRTMRLEVIISCQNLLYHHEVGGDNFQTGPVKPPQSWRWQFTVRIRWTTDEAGGDVVSPLWSGIKITFHALTICKFLIKEIDPNIAIIGQSGVLCFLDRKGMVLQDFLKPEQTSNSDNYVVTCTHTQQNYYIITHPHMLPTNAGKFFRIHFSF